MKRLLPSPLLSASLAVLWLLLSPSRDAGTLLLAVAVGLGVPLLTSSLRPGRARLAKPGLILRLTGVVGVDVVSSALQVVRGVVSGGGSLRSAFVEIPLDLQDAHGLAALALITTVVPGTVWCELAAGRRAVVLHVFDVDDEAAFISHYKQRYERPLKEIFQ